MANTFDPTRTPSGWTLSLGDKKVEKTSSGLSSAWQAVLAYWGGGSNIYFEAKISRSSSGNYQGSVGLIPEGRREDFDSGVRLQDAGFAYRGSGGLSSLGTAISLPTSYGNGDTIMIAVRGSDGGFFTGKNGTWDRNPATQAPRGRLPFVGLGRWYVAVECRNQNNAVEIVTATADFAYTVPSGYISLDDLIVSPVPEELIASTVLVEALQEGTGELRSTQTTMEVLSVESAPTESLDVTHVSLETIQEGVGEMRATHASVEVLQVESRVWVTHVTVEALNPDLAGFPPTITAEVLGDLVRLFSSVFSGFNQTHVSSTWQVTLTADTGFASPVFSEVGTDEELLTILVPNLDYETTYRARVRHVGSAGTTPYSEPVVFTTAPDPTVRPNPPVLTLQTPFTVAGATILVSPFTHPDGQVDPPDFDIEDPKPYPQDFEWAVIELGGDFADPLFQTDDADMWEKLQFIWPGLPGVYQFRARWLDGRDGVWSLYSNVLQITVPDFGPIPDFDVEVDQEADNVLCVEPGSSSTGQIFITAGRVFSPGSPIDYSVGWKSRILDSNQRICLTLLERGTEVQLEAWVWPGNYAACGAAGVFNTIVANRLLAEQSPNCLLPAPVKLGRLKTPPQPKQAWIRTDQVDPLSKVPGAFVDSVFRIYFDITPGDTYIATISDDDGVNYQPMPAGTVEAPNYIQIDPAALSDGWYMVRIVTVTTDSYLGTGEGWPVYFPFRKGGQEAVVETLDFKTMSEMPAYQRVMDDTERLEWGFIQGRGVTARPARDNPGYYVVRGAGITFDDLGEPTVYEGVLTYSRFAGTSERNWYPWRFNEFSYLDGGVVALAKGTNSELPANGVILGSRSFNQASGWGGLGPFDSRFLQSILLADPVVSRSNWRYGVGSNTSFFSKLFVRRLGGPTSGSFVFPPTSQRNQGLVAIDTVARGDAVHTVRFRITVTETQVIYSLMEVGSELQEVGWTFEDRVLPREGPPGARGFLDGGGIGLSLDGVLHPASTVWSEGMIQYHSLVVHVYDDQPVPPPPPPPLKVPCILDRYLFFGTSGSDELELYQDIHTDPGDEAITSVALTREIAPFGVGGEALFTNVYFTLTAWTTGIVVITPVINGEEKLEAQRMVAFESDGLTEFTKRYEIALYELVEEDELQIGRHGLRGTFFQLKVELQDTLGAGRVSLGGFELETEPVVNISQDQVYSPQPSVPTTVPIAGRSQFFGSVGTDELRVYREINMDVDEDVPLLARSRQAAPLGPGGEAIFTRLHMPIYRDNADMVLVSIVPIVNGERYPELTLELDGVDTPIREVRHLDLYEPIMDGMTEVGRQAIRGTWWGVEIKVEDGVMVGGLRFGGIELEFEPVTESEVEQ